MTPFGARQLPLAPLPAAHRREHAQPRRRKRVADRADRACRRGLPTPRPSHPPGRRPRVERLRRHRACAGRLRPPLRHRLLLLFQGAWCARRLGRVRGCENHHARTPFPQDVRRSHAPVGGARGGGSPRAGAPSRAVDRRPRERQAARRRVPRRSRAERAAAGADEHGLLRPRPRSRIRRGLLRSHQTRWRVDAADGAARVRAVCHLDVDRAMVERAIGVLAEAAGARSPVGAR